MRAWRVLYTYVLQYSVIVQKYNCSDVLSFITADILLGHKLVAQERRSLLWNYLFQTCFWRVFH